MQVANSGENMDFSGINLFGLVKKRMAYLSERHAVLSKNIANADTPGYKPMDLKPVDFRSMVASESSLKTNLETTNPGHIKGLSGNNRFSSQKQGTTFEVKPSGNQVVVEEQMMKIAENNIDYQTATGIYKKMTEIMRVAIGGGR